MSSEPQPQSAPPGQKLHFPLGLLGLEQMKRFVLTSHEHESPFSWLQTEDDDSIAFLVVSPFEVLPTYEPDISNEDAAFLKLTGPGDAQLYNIVTLRKNGDSSVNLKGPIVVNRHTLIAKQVVPLNAVDYSVRHPLPTAD
jgi:flagellar assembly factor FliW